MTGILATLLIFVQIAISHPVLTYIVNRCADEFVDGEFQCGRASVSILRTYPDMLVEVEDLSFDYPEDTTILSGASASFRAFALTVNVPDLFSGKANVSCLKIDSMLVAKPVLVNGRYEIASLPLNLDCALSYSFEDNWVDASGDLVVSRCDLKSLINGYALDFVPYIDSFNSSAFFGLDLGFAVSVAEKTSVDLHVKKLTAETSGLELMLKCKADDVTGLDPSFSIDASLDAALDKLVEFLPDSLGIDVRGLIKADVKGDAKLSQLNVYNFSSSTLKGELTAENLSVKMPADSIDATIDSLKIVLGQEEKTVGRDEKKTLHLMGVTGTVAKADVSYKDELKVKGEGLLLSAKNMMDTEISLDTVNIHPFSGRFAAKRLSVSDSQGTAIRLSNTSNSFRVMPKFGNNAVPVLSLSSRNDKIFLRSQYNRVAFSDADLRVSAAMNGIERRQKVKAFMDSLSTAYPDVSRDSLFIHYVRSKGERKFALPDWLQEEDFRKQDIDIRLDGALARYFREWDINGGLKVEKGMVMTPYFPLRNTLGGFDLKFTNNDVKIAKFQVKSGESNISATGALTGLRSALLGRRGAMKLNVDVTSEGVDANQLLYAYNTGMNFNPEKFGGNSEDVSDEEFLEQVILDTSDVATVPSLIVVPANLMAEVRLNASNVKYSDLQINTMTADLVMRERCVRITDTKALTNMGDISMEGFYSTRNKNDLKTGFSINFKDITAEKVINLMPAIDTLMPLLKSFGGLLNCEIAATAQLDTNMNLIMPTINGVMRMGGENLTISDNDMFKKLAKVLMFRNKNKGQIDKMTVEGVISDSRLEVFPFILEMDRYMLGLSGVQNMDMSFRYHASLIKSPLIIRLGMDVYGPDFDNMKFKLGRPKYKNRNVPVFSTVIDDAKVNLVQSIRNIYDKGVDAVVNENKKMRNIEEHRRKIGYVRAVDQQLEELSAEEQTQMEEAAKNEETQVEPVN